MDATKENKPLRILVIIYPQSPLFANSEVKAILQQALVQLNAIEADVRTLFLATWTYRTVMVFDLCHEHYDFAQAYHPEDLPALAIHFQTNEKVKTGMVPEQKRLEVNNEVARYHNLHGYGTLPMVEDHRNGNVPT
ncbi:hypothetical protein DM02DRAFT_543849 [Periconia macrospinosa]|uniref:Uncharacterized protein n=1 Tax=Periconia macrospinosa TaxID=97972 RepID=A0A2V1D3Z4_9PLEO|nr:hypothetical protein DM02DRAFT_543849 [Periconia macrospinosa]